MMVKNKHRRNNNMWMLSLLLVILAAETTAHISQNIPPESFVSYASNAVNTNQQHYGSGLITRCDAPGIGGYFIPKDKYPYAKAVPACKALGGYLADLSNQKILLASDIVLTCVGPNKRACIGSWDYKAINLAEDNNLDCLSVFVGNIGPGGGLDNLCPGNRPVLCQLLKSNVPLAPLDPAIAASKTATSPYLQTIVSSECLSFSKSYQGSATSPTESSMANELSASEKDNYSAKRGGLPLKEEQQENNLFKRILSLY